MATEMLSEHPLLSEPSSVSFYNWMSNAVGNRGSVVQDSPVTKLGHNSLPTGIGNSSYNFRLLGFNFSMLLTVLLG